MAQTSTKKVKNYVKGSSKEHVFDNGGSLIHLDIKGEGALITSTGKILPNDAGYFKVTLSKLPEPDKYGNTHTLYENDWKPTAKTAPAPAGKTPLKAKDKDEFPKDDLPF